MKQGAALTALALYSISFTPTSIHEKYRTEIELGFTFLEKGTPVRNRVANPDGSLDHPVYSTSMYLVASHRLGRELEPAIVEPLLIYLVSSQCTEGRGFNPSNPNHGGWDVIGPDVQPGKTAGTNVSATRFVLEAFNSYVPLTGQATVRIKDSVIESVSKSRQQAAVWLKRVQNMNRDGGFRFSAQPNSALNKASTEDGDVLSYGTATCDGWLGLQLAGLATDKSADSAKRWMKSNLVTTEVAGFPETDFKSSWPEAVKFYYFQTLSHVLNHSRDEDWSSKHRGELTILLEQLQKPDGRFENETALMREDDPIIATSFAVIAISRAR